MATEPEAIRFIKDRKWPGTDSRILDIPWDEIVNDCIGAWQNIADPTFSGNVLPDALRKGYLALLGNENTTQEEADAFTDELRDYVGDMSYSQLADWYVQLNDPNTIRTVLYLHDGIEYVDEKCTMPWKQDQ